MRQTMASNNGIKQWHQKLTSDNGIKHFSFFLSFFLPFSNFWSLTALSGVGFLYIPFFLLLFQLHQAMVTDNAIKQWHQTMASDNDIKQWHQTMTSSIGIKQWHQT